MVISQDGAVIFVRNGGTYARVHHSRLRKVDDPQAMLGEMDNQLEGTDNHTKLPESRFNENKNDTENESEEETPTNDESPHASREPGLGDHGQSDTSQTHSVTTCAGLRLQTGQVVTYTDSGSGQAHTGKILSRAGKATGTHKNWYNLQYIEPEKIAGTSRSVVLGQVGGLQVVPSDHAEVCADCHEDDIVIVNDDAFMPAKHAELCNWKRNDVFEEVKDEGQKCISMRWVCPLKESPDGVVPKARLVARGFEEMNTMKLPKDSPTCASESLKMIMAVIVCQKKWQLNSMDIKAAIFQGKELTRHVYIRPPQEAQSKGTLWKLKKCVYSLADASLYW